MNMRLGILHPGDMGSSIAAAARHTLGTVYWCSEGRSNATRQRADAHKLTDIPQLQAFCLACDMIIAVCPPHAALELAHTVIAAGFRGIYVEANAVSPETVRRIAGTLEATGITCIDGGIIGLPAWQAGTTWLYLSGPDADKVQACFSKGPLQTAVLGEEIGSASALKMCYAAWNKGSTALLTAVLAAAQRSGVRNALEQQWDIYNPGFTGQSHARIAGVARKAWRFSGEMHEIAATLQATGVPSEFFAAAARVYESQAACKDMPEQAAIDHILQLVTSNISSPWRTP